MSLINGHESLRDDRGVSALIIAAGMLLFLGITALAVDLGLGYNERRIDQTSADSGVMAGALDAYKGAAGLRDATMDLVRKNLPTTYSSAEWDALWDGCTDPNRPPNFQPVPSTGGMVNPTIDCISVNPLGQSRVRIPDQKVDTAFAKAIGFASLSINAEAEATFIPTPDTADIIPLGHLSNALLGQEICLVRPTITTRLPCTPADRANFEALDVPYFGNTELSTAQTCAGSSSQRLAGNFRRGIDHFVTFHPDGNDDDGFLDVPPFDSDDDFVPDECGNFAPNRVEHFTPSWLAVIGGLIENGSQPGTARLQQGGNPKIVVDGFPVDNRPLWDYLNSTNTIPACNPAHSDYNTTPIDMVLAKATLESCLSGSGGQRIFSSSILNSPRFVLIPQVWETAWPGGLSTYVTVRRLRPVFLQGLHFGCNTDPCAVTFDPDPTLPSPVSVPIGARLDQVSGYLLPLSSLDLGSILEGPNDDLGPFEPELSG